MLLQKHRIETVKKRRTKINLRENIETIKGAKSKAPIIVPKL